MSRPTTSITPYKPDYAVAPGETLFEVIEKIGMTQAELAERTGRPVKTINEIIKGKTAITSETALQFERALGVSASFWNNLEKNYQETLTRLAEEKILENQISYLDKFPIKFLMDNDWISKSDNKITTLKNLLSFFGVASPVQLDSLIEKKFARFRESNKFSSDPWAVATWLRKGELEAQRILCSSYDEELFIKKLSFFRKLTRKAMNPELCEKWINICKECGVALVLLQELPGMKVNAATFWLTKTKPVILLTLRWKLADILWFSFFHEAGHIINHKKKDIFIEDNNIIKDKEEKEADQFAADLLIPPQDYSSFVNVGVFSHDTIQNFAKQLGISPGIVVGRLQHDMQIKMNYFNDLKTRVKWAE